jgi:hypothetical protein
MAAPEGWEPLIAELAPHVSPEWRRHADEHGGQPWIRLILLVDAHFQLATPRVAEKVAMTMADLARDGTPEQEGWNALQERAKEDRLKLIQRLLDAADELLSEELLPLFTRSIEPTLVR